MGGGKGKKLLYSHTQVKRNGGTFSSRQITLYPHRLLKNMSKNKERKRWGNGGKE